MLDLRTGVFPLLQEHGEGHSKEPRHVRLLITHVSSVFLHAAPPPYHAMPCRAAPAAPPFIPVRKYLPPSLFPSVPSLHSPTSFICIHPPSPLHPALPGCWPSIYLYTQPTILDRSVLVSAHPLKASRETTPNLEEGIGCLTQANQPHCFASYSLAPSTGGLCTVRSTSIDTYPGFQVLCAPGISLSHRARAV